MTTSNTQRASGSVIAFGANTPNLLEERLQHLGAPERLVLIDPLIETGSTEGPALGEDETTRIVNAALAAEDGEAEMILYSFPGLNSLHTPMPELLSIFPGLRERQRETVRTLSPEGLKAQLTGLPAPFRVWIDTPGTEAEILNALDMLGLLDQIETLELRCGSAAFFNSAWNRQALESWLTEKQFQLVEADETDPDWPELRFKADISARRITTLESRLKALDRKYASTRAEAAQALKKKDKTLAERDTALEKAQAALREHEDAIAERDARITEKDEAIEKLKADLTARDKTLVERDATLSRLRQEIATALEAADQAKADGDGARQDLRLALHTQASLQANLDDLRQRYRRLHEEKARQDDLLEQLTPRLREAAQQLRESSLPAEESPKKAIKSASKNRRHAKSAKTTSKSTK